MNVVLFGLGSMGFSIALNMLKGGHKVWGVDVDAGKVAALVAQGGEPTVYSDHLADIDAVVLTVVNEAQVTCVLFDDPRLCDQLHEHSIIICLSTVSPEFARETEQKLQNKNLIYLDCPMSGAAARAKSGELTLMVSGDETAITRVKGIFDSISANVFNLGSEAGLGSAMKATNQLLAGVHIMAMAEAMAFGRSQGISFERFMEVIPKCAGTSWILENRAPTILSGDYTPKSTVDIWPKDLGIIQKIAEGTGQNIPITRAALQRYNDAIADGLASEDDAAVVKTYLNELGIEDCVLDGSL
jgi:putative dehydrogenase